MIDLAPILAQIQSLGLFRTVGGAAEAAAVMEGKVPAGDGPNAYVIPLADAPSTPKSVLPVQQDVVSGIGVVIMVRGAGDPSGFTGIAGLPTLRKGLLAGLTGFELFSGAQGLWWSAGRLIEFAPGTVWWMDAYATRYAVVQSQNF